ncbi:MAG: hypothetical protein S4CHLAM7_04260 [Chlamydiae bacterium]|nr:hypothetical protein [Chlamydiota bacterium]
MSTISGTLEMNGNPFDRAEVIKKTNQSSLKGAAWQTAGNALGMAALATTGACGLFSSSAVFANMLFSEVSSISTIATNVVATVITDYILLQAAATCFSNAIHHLSADTEMRYQSPNAKQHTIQV